MGGRDGAAQPWTQGRLSLVSAGVTWPPCFSCLKVSPPCYRGLLLWLPGPQAAAEPQGSSDSLSAGLEPPAFLS